VCFCSLYLCIQLASARARNSSKQAFGGCIRDTATVEARSIDSDRFAESKSIAPSVATSTGSVKSSRVLPSGLSRDYWTHRALSSLGFHE